MTLFLKILHKFDPFYKTCRLSQDFDFDMTALRRIRFKKLSRRFNPPDDDDLSLPIRIESTC